MRKNKPGRPPITRENNPIYQRMNARNITFESLSERVGMPVTTVRDLVGKADGGKLKWEQFEKFLKVLHAVGLDIKEGEIK